MIDIEPELLESLFWGNGYGVMQIANIFDCSEDTVYDRMDNYGIPTLINYKLTDFAFTDKQKQVFEGCMLGDGGLTWRGNNCYFDNIDIHKEYLIWLQKQLGAKNISNVKSTFRDGYFDKYRLRTRVIPSLKDEYRRWYPDGAGTRDNLHRKVIPKDVELTLINVMFWYIGDGHYHKKDRCMYFGNYLSLEDAMILKDKLGILLNVDNGITVNKHGKNGKGNQIYNLRLNRIVTNEFFELTDNLGFDIPECYKYKFGV